MERSLSWSLLGHYSSTYTLQLFFSLKKIVRSITSWWTDQLDASTHQKFKSPGTGVAQGRGGCWGNVEAWNWSTSKSQGSVVSYWLKVELLSRSFTIKNVMFNGKWMLFYGVRVNTWPNNLKMKQINSGYHSTFIFVHMYLRLRNLLHFLSSSCNL